MDNVIQFPKTDTGNKEEVQKTLIQNLVENGASLDRATSISERMSPFLEIFCGFEFHPDLPETPSASELQLSLGQLVNRFEQFREELLIERISAESWNTKDMS